MRLRHSVLVVSLAWCSLGLASETATTTPPPARKPKLAVPDARPPARQFQIKIKIENGHIGDVLIGCRDGASDDYDMRIDDMAPPPGIGGIGYTFLVSPDRKYNLYKDIRAYAETVQWLFYARTGAKPVRLHWSADEIPAGWDLYAARWDGKSEVVQETINCRQTTELVAPETTFFRFWIQKSTDK